MVTTSPLNARQMATIDKSRITLRRTNRIEGLLRAGMADEGTAYNVE